MIINGLTNGLSERDMNDALQSHVSHISVCPVEKNHIIVHVVWARFINIFLTTLMDSLTHSIYSNHMPSLFGDFNLIF